jgi:hypothetical protein
LVILLPAAADQENVLRFEARLAFSGGTEQWELNPATLKVNYLAAAEL